MSELLLSETKSIRQTRHCCKSCLIQLMLHCSQMSQTDTGQSWLSASPEILTVPAHRPRFPLGTVRLDLSGCFLQIEHGDIFCRFPGTVFWSTALLVYQGIQFFPDSLGVQDLLHVEFFSSFSSHCLGGGVAWPGKGMLIHSEL